MKNIACFLLIFQCVFFGTIERAFAQAKPSTFVDSVLWPQIAFQLERDPTPDSYNFISALVNTYHINNADSLYKVYEDIFTKLGEKINSGASIYVSEQMVKIARDQNNILNEARALTKLAFQYDAIGQPEVMNINIDKAIQLYGKLGKREQVILLKLNLVDRRLESKSTSQMFVELDSLLQELVHTVDKPLLLKAYANSLRIAIGDSNVAHIQKYINLLEGFLHGNPAFAQETAPLIYLNMGKGWVAYYKNDLGQADNFFRQALYYCEAAPSRWLEVNTLQCLSMVELKRKNTQFAKAYLDRAETKAVAMRSDDLLMANFDLKAKVAKEEGDYKAALSYIEQKLAHEKRFNDKSKGFSLEKYYLQKEKEQLASDKKNRELELSIKSSQLTKSILIIFLIVIIALAFVMAFINQRNKKIELLKKNNLIEQQATELKKLDVAKSNFFANISHELRTPLSLIVGPINTILKHGILPEKYAQILKTANQSAKHLEAMIKDILDLRKLETGNMAVKSESTGIASFFKTHLDQFESLANSREINFSHNITIDKDVFVELDREKNRQIVYNLLSNAFKFTPPSGKVNVSVWMENNELHVKVCDTGYGIHPEDMPFIFDRFFRAERKSEKAVSGTGIGLSICYEMATLLNGQIKASNLPGGGTEFWYSMPLVLSKNQGDPIKLVGTDEYSFDIEMNKNVNEQEVVGEKTKPMVLVVEDNEGLQAYLKLILSDACQVKVAENGAVAWKLLNVKDSGGVQLVVSDLMMPVMDGYELLKNIKSADNTRHLPVIMLTAKAESDDRLKALRIGVDDYMTKPFEEEELLVRVENLLGNQRNRQKVIAEEAPDKEAAPTITGADLEWLTTFEQFITENLKKDDLSVPELSSEFAMSASTLLRQLKRLTGMSPAQYLQEMRLNQARHLMEIRAFKTVAEVASKVGYNDARTFSRNFKGRFGKLPSDFL